METLKALRINPNTINTVKIWKICFQKVTAK
jgi:hypothetical protein